MKNNVAVLVCQEDTQVGNYIDVDFIAVDAGYLALIRANLPIKLLIGDLDSLKDVENYRCNVSKFNQLKDETDTHLAIKYAIKEQYQKIVILGVTTKRMDHFINVLQLLLIYKNYDIEIHDEYNRIFLLTKDTIIKNEYRYISFFSFKSSIVSTAGLLYELDNYEITPFTFQTVSNQIIKDTCEVNTDGELFVFLTKD